MEQAQERGEGNQQADSEQMTTCPDCGLEYEEDECWICAPMKRVLAKAREHRREYGLKKMAERADSFIERSQPREQE